MVYNKFDVTHLFILYIDYSYTYNTLFDSFAENPVNCKVPAYAH